jgi:hypothetical protein
MSAETEQRRAETTENRVRPQKYEAPRLRTLGSLRQITLGSGAPLADGGNLKSVASQ